jgi:HSP20 family protein
MANERGKSPQEHEARTSSHETQASRSGQQHGGGASGSGQHAGSATGGSGQQHAGGSRESRGVTRRESGTTPMLGANPFSIMRRFMEDLDRLYVGDMRMPGGGEWAPAVDMVERDGRLVVRADVPGLGKDDVSVEIDDGHLVISGERSQQHEERREGVYRSECTYGHFHRVIALPEGAEADQAKATFKNGVLEITMPLTARHHPRRLPVQDATSAGA